MPKPEITDIALIRIAANGPQSAELLGEEARALELTTARDPIAVVTRKLRSDRRFAELPGGMWTTVLRLVEGRWFTHRLREDEAQSGTLSDSLDLGVPLIAVGESVPLHGGGTARVHRDHLTGIGLQLAEAAPGTLIGVTFTAGTLRVVPLDDLERAAYDGTRVADAIRAKVPAHDWRHRSCPSDEATRALVRALAADATLLTRPVQPLSQLVPDLVERRTSWNSDDLSRCNVWIDEGCGCYRCGCFSEGRLSMDLDGAAVHAATRLLAVRGVSLADHLAAAVLAALQTDPSAGSPDRAFRRAVDSDDETEWSVDDGAA